MSCIKINGKKYPIPDGSTPKATYDSLKMVMPEITNSKLTKDGDNYKVETSYGRKG